MKIQFTTKIVNGVPKGNADYHDYLKSMEGKELIQTLQEKIASTEKERMMRFLRGALTQCLIVNFRDSGYEVVTEYNVLENMKEQFLGVSRRDLHGNDVRRIPSLADLNKADLLQFINDIIQFIKTIWPKSIIPDSQEYLKKKR